MLECLGLLRDQLGAGVPQDLEQTQRAKTE